ALAYTDFGESLTFVEGNRGRVVGSDLQEDHTVRGDRERLAQQTPADAPTLIFGIDTDGVDLVFERALPPEPRNAGVADELAVGTGGDVMVVLGFEPGQKRAGRPRVVATEQLRFQLGAPRGVGPVQRAVHDRHRATTGWSGRGLASGLRR